MRIVYIISVERNRTKEVTYEAHFDSLNLNRSISKIRIIRGTQNPLLIKQRGVCVMSEEVLITIYCVKFVGTVVGVLFVSMYLLYKYDTGISKN